MTDSNSDPGKKVIAIVDDAIAELILLGNVGDGSLDAAAYTMACLASLKIEDNERRRELEDYVSQLVFDVDDTGGAK